MCDLFRNNRLLVEMREGGEKKEAVATHETGGASPVRVRADV